MIVVPLAGGGAVECDGETFELAPPAHRCSTDPTDIAYVGIDQTYT